MKIISGIIFIRQPNILYHTTIYFKAKSTLIDGNEIFVILFAYRVVCKWLNMEIPQYNYVGIALYSG